MYAIFVVVVLLKVLLEALYIVCISPLTSLMTDQCSRFASRGLRTAFMDEAQMDREVKKLALLGEYQLLYLTPESLMSSHSVYRDTLLSSKYTGICYYQVSIKTIL